VATCALLVLAAALTGCSHRTDTVERASASRPPRASATSTGGSPSHASTPTGGPTTGRDRYAVADPGPFRPPLYPADVLVTSSRTIPTAVRHRLAAVHGVAKTMPMSFAALSINGRTLSIAAADPAEFRRFTPVQSAQANAVWSRVAGGEVAVDPSLPRRLEDRSGYLRLGTAADAPEVHIGAFAPLVKQISAVVDVKRAEQLGMPRDNALLVSTGEVTPSAISGKLKKVLGPDATMQILALEFRNPVQTAVLSTSSVTSRVGTFNYSPHPDGTVSPDPRWVHSYIRTETVPIIGRVTCNKGMIPQLRAALTDVVRHGLAERIHPGQYGGCYVPRYIAHDPAKGLSLHTWGIAIDLNVPENQRGTVGRMDRTVVSIFEKWGFAWGGDWSYTDPMHFEMDRVVDVH
jgi:hypothetical protein